MDYQISNKIRAWIPWDQVEDDTKRQREDIERSIPLGAGRRNRQLTDSARQRVKFLISEAT